MYRIKARAASDLSNNAVGRADSLTFFPVCRRDKLLGQHQRLALATQHRLDVTDISHVHRELVELSVRQVTLEMDQRTGSTQPLTGRLEPSAHTSQ